MLTVVCLLMTVVSTGCIPTKQPQVQDKKVPAWLEGSWRGIGYQINLQQTWAIELDVATTATVNYPSLECSGAWSLVKNAEGLVEFEEAILKGVNRCVNGGRIVITRIDQHHISYSFFEPQNGKLEAHSTLVDVEFDASKKI